MQGVSLVKARKARGFTQQQTAKRLSVSQPFLSQMESGVRPMQQDLALRAFKLFHEPTLLPLDADRRDSEDHLAEELSTLGYPGFAHLPRRRFRNPAELLLDALDRSDLDTRLAEALPWLPLRYTDLDWLWLLAAVKQRNRQNRLGFVVALAQQLTQRLPDFAPAQPTLHAITQALEQARLANPGTYCHDSWSQRQRDQTDKRRSALAGHWNLSTGVKLEHLAHYAA